MRRSLALVLFMPMATTLSGCGTYVPQIQEFWEGVDVTGDMEWRIKQNIFCETVHALRAVRQTILVDHQRSIPDSYGVQLQVNLTVEEVGALNPSVALNNTIPNGLVNKVTVPQSFVFNGAATLSSTATRTDTFYSYYNVGNISRPGANSWCEDVAAAENIHLGSSPLLKYNLGIEDYLREQVQGADVLSSSAPAKGGAGKTAKVDVYSYEVKFVVVTSASASPVWKLVNVSAGTGSLPLVNAGRTRTHDLILTFGPGTNAPADFALQTHFTNQIVQSNQLRLQQLQQLQQNGQ
jgi:hypothetical protein